MQCRSFAIVIPTYNEETSVGALIGKVRELVPDAEIVVIDDGSSDQSASVALAAGARVISHPRNKGNGAAVKTALRALDVDTIVIIDADGQHPPEMIPLLLKESEKYDLVVAARSTESGEIRHRRVGNWMLCNLASYLSEVEIPDLTSGFRAIDRRKALEFIHLYPNGFSFPTTSTLAFISAGYNVTFVPMPFRKRQEGTQSKIRPVADGWRFGMMILRISTMINPLRVFLPTALSTLIIGILWTVLNVLRHEAFPAAGTLLITVGLNILFFGIVVDQLTAMRLRGRE